MKRGICKLGKNCAFKDDRKGWRANQRSERTFDTQAGNVTSLKFRAKGDFLHGVSPIPVRTGKTLATTSSDCLALHRIL